MTRVVLCLVLAGGSLGLGLLTALQQAENRARGAALNERMEQCHLLECITRERSTALLAQDWGALPPDPLVLKRAKPPAHAQGVRP